MGWKLKELLPPPPGKARNCKRWWILVCPLSHCELTHQLALGVGKQGGRYQSSHRWSPTKDMSNPTLSTWGCLNHHSLSPLRRGFSDLLDIYLLQTTTQGDSFSQQCAFSHYLCNSALVALLCLLTNSCVRQLCQRQGRGVSSQVVFDLSRMRHLI